MIHMDVDIHPPGPHSPSFRSMRQYSGKRARSPEPSSPIDRPSKRLSLATGLSGRAGYRTASSSRETSEDWVWVQQTGDLAIASPACGAFAGRGIDEEKLELVADIDMAIDHDAIMDENFDAPSMQGLSTHSKSTPPLASHPPDQASDQHSVLSSASRLPYAHSINMASAHSADALPEPVSTPPPPPSPAPMSISPESSFAQLPQSQRKPRFTMGPRSDCEKCRLGVKGHWMHLD